MILSPFMMAERIAAARLTTPESIPAICAQTKPKLLKDPSDISGSLPEVSSRVRYRMQR